ncbi:MAG: glucosaminidase domain-containing protein [Bacteroidetes bacterium]|nr:glucosaminidase domain-containing protein [Bacteroidota bacterium]MBK9423339.1 glucosaminidase domain-containing protein [Bacteroidota bacterium]
MYFNTSIIKPKLPLLRILILLLIPLSVFGQSVKKFTPADYISMYKDDAIKDMMKMGVPASITLSQGILESESGNSDLAREAKNHFGIKCHSDWTGPGFHKDDDAKDECFRQYQTVLESFDDHSKFLRERHRYAFLFDYEITDYKSWAHGLKKAGYATNPRYADLLIKLIEENRLYDFDKGGKKMPVINSIPAPIAAHPQPRKPKHSVSSKSSEKPVKHARAAKPATNKNEVPFVNAKEGDTWFSIAVGNDMRLWQILKYNDASQNDELNPGDIVYLKPKRGRPASAFHTVAPGETLWMISQKHGIKLSKLIKLNNLEESIAVKEGQQIKLR